MKFPKLDGLPHWRIKMPNKIKSNKNIHKTSKRSLNLIETNVLKPFVDRHLLIRWILILVEGIVGINLREKFLLNALIEISEIFWKSCFWKR